MQNVGGQVGAVLVEDHVAPRLGGVLDAAQEAHGEGHEDDRTHQGERDRAKHSPETRPVELRGLVDAARNAAENHQVQQHVPAHGAVQTREGGLRLAHKPTGVGDRRTDEGQLSQQAQSPIHRLPAKIEKAA